jgi:hypothetical protein
MNLIVADVERFTIRLNDLSGKPEDDPQNRKLRERSITHVLKIEDRLLLIINPW